MAKDSKKSKDKGLEKLDDMFESITESQGEVLEDIAEESIEVEQDVITKTLSKTEKEKLAKKESAARSRARVKGLEEAFSKEMADKPGMEERIHIWTDKIELVNSLGYGDGDGFVQSVKANKEAGIERQLSSVSKIVGAVLRNNTGEDITTYAEPFKKAEDGSWVTDGLVEVTWKNGETMNFPTKTASMFCMKVEVSCAVANAKMRRSGKDSKGQLDVELESYYFTLNKDFKEANGLTGTHDDQFKIAIAEQVSPDKWVVKPEFETEFGDYNNEVPKPGRLPRAAKKKKIDAGALLASHMRNFVQKNGVEA